MQSADREVRLFAVRLLWEKHRPRALPPGWRPRGGKPAQDAVPGARGESPAPPGAPPLVIDDAGRFADAGALRGFLRDVLFGLPGGRAAEPRDDAAAKRRLPASVAKQRVIEVVRDLAIEDAAFAELSAPVIAEFTGSMAKGEWQACLSALMRLRKAHPGLSLDEGGLARASATSAPEPPLEGINGGRTSTTRSARSRP
jgi:hypothetical protein